MAEEHGPAFESRSRTLTSALRLGVEQSGNDRDSNSRHENDKVSAEPLVTVDSSSKRVTSLSFKSPIVGSPGQNGISVNSPPKPDPRQRGRSLLAEIAAENELGNIRPRPRVVDSQITRYDAFTGQPIMRRQSRRERQAALDPVLQTTEDTLVEDEEFQGGGSSIPSSASTSTISPPFNSVKTPSELGDEYLKSLDDASTPILIPENASFPRTFSRSKTYQIEKTGSLRRVSRRSSTRTGSSSFSPAGAFLSQYRDEPAAQTEPDEEGQEIGDNSEYIIGRQIGFGGFSVVKEVFTIENDEKVLRAVKIVRKQLAGQSEQANEDVQNEFEHEVSIWRCLKHRYILPLLAVYDNSFATFCIIQYNAGGTLFDLIRRQRKTNSFIASSKTHPLAEARGISPRARAQTPLPHLKRYLYQIACALRYLHQDMHIVHRDLKLENCLIDTSSSLAQSLSDSISSLSSLSNDPPSHPGSILLCDFGMADWSLREDRDANRPFSAHSSTDLLAEAAAAVSTAINSNANSTSNSTPAMPVRTHNIGPGPASINLSTSTNVAGSLQYAAPELIRASKPLYDPSIDMWAFGVVAFALLTGELPFSHSLAPKVQLQILQGDWDVAVLKEGVGRAVPAADGSGSGHVDGDGDLEAQVLGALELVRGCLDMNPLRRWDVARVLECGFFAGGAEAYERLDDV